MSRRILILGNYHDWYKYTEIILALSPGTEACPNIISDLRHSTALEWKHVESLSFFIRRMKYFDNESSAIKAQGNLLALSTVSTWDDYFAKYFIFSSKLYKLLNMMKIKKAKLYSGILYSPTNTS